LGRHSELVIYPRPGLAWPSVGYELSNYFFISSTPEESQVFVTTSETKQSTCDEGSSSSTLPSEDLNGRSYRNVVFIFGVRDDGKTQEKVVMSPNKVLDLHCCTVLHVVSISYLLFQLMHFTTL
jgi:hypothetical protein